MELVVDLPSDLIERAQQRAKRDGVPLSAIIEEALRASLDVPKRAQPFKLRDLSVRGDGLQPGLPESTWERIRELAYDPWPEDLTPEA